MKAATWDVFAREAAIIIEASPDKVRPRIRLSSSIKSQVHLLTSLLPF